MADSWSRKLTGELIDLYRQMPCLWKVKSKPYFNRNLKMQSYKRLIDLVKPHFPEADKEFIRKRIQSLRGGFRKEMHKVAESKRSGKGAEEIYVPTLWYYEKMLFSLDQETSSASMSNIDEDPGPSFLEESSEVDGNDISTNNLEGAKASIIEKDPAESETQPDDREEEVPIRNNPPNTAIRKSGKKRKPEQDASEFYRTCTEALKAPSTSKVDITEFEAIGIKIGKQLQRMEMNQAIYAESIITAVLRRGLFRSLNPRTDLCDNNCTAIAMANCSGSTAGSNSSHIEGS